MRAILLLICGLIWLAVIEGSLRVWEADDEHRAAVGACLARTYKTVSQCEEAP